MQEMQKTITPCRVCAEAKPNAASDRGLRGALPIQAMMNEILSIQIQIRITSSPLWAVSTTFTICAMPQMDSWRGGTGIQRMDQEIRKPQGIYNDNDVKKLSAVRIQKHSRGR